MVVATAVTVALAAGGPCRTEDCNERVFERWCRERGSVKACIHRAALRWDVGFHMLVRKAACETGGTFNPLTFNPTLVNGEHASGLFQFLPSTYASTPYRKHSLWRAKWSALAAAWMHRVGRGGEWECK